MNPWAGPVYLLPGARDSGVRSALTTRLRRLGIAVVTDAAAGATVVIVAVQPESSMVRVERSIAESALPHLAISDDEPDDAQVTAAALAGLQGWISAAIGDAALLATLEEVADGGTAWRRRHAGILVRALRRRDNRHVARADGVRVELSAREYLVLENLAEGRTTAEVARRLGISTVTIRGYISSAVRRLNAADRDDAVDLFVRTRLTSTQ